MKHRHLSEREESCFANPYAHAARIFTYHARPQDGQKRQRLIDLANLSETKSVAVAGDRTLTSVRPRHISVPVQMDDIDPLLHPQPRGRFLQSYSAPSKTAMYTCLNACLFTRLNTCLHACLCTCVYAHSYMRAHMCVCMSAHVSAHMSV